MKFIEIRDAGTFIPAVAFLITGDDHYLARRAGFGDNPLIILLHLSRMAAQWDPFEWDNRTMLQAHLWINDNWDSIQTGDVVDVEYILGETKNKKVSEEHS